MTDVDPAELEGEALERWYRRTPDEIEAERALARQLSYDEFFNRERRLRDASDDGALADRSLVYDQVGPNRWRARDAADPGAARFQEVRLTLPPSPPPIPSGLQVGPPVDAMGRAPAGSGSGFFRNVAPTPNPFFGPAYISELPSPLNYVQPRPDGSFTLGDGRIVRSGIEVERIYAEQKRRMQYGDDPEPSRIIVHEDRLPDGKIPRADQLEKGKAEWDPTCHPYGGWEIDPIYPSYPEDSKRYEEQVTRAPGVDYVVRAPGFDPVKFDGCAVWDPRHELLEAKGPGYAGLFERSERYEPFGRSVREKVDNQAKRQSAVAKGRPIDWYVAEPAALGTFRDVVEPRPINLLLDLPR